MNGKIILASASPRRQELLRYVVPEFEVIPADVDETLPEGIPPEKAAEFLAEKKARCVAERYPNAVVIGSDTVVIIDGIILGKPADKSDAERMLKLLSGKVHKVVTGVCLARGERAESFSCETKVKFYPLTDGEIRAYIATGEPMDKAGAYGIQGYGSVLSEGIEGDFFNVMGLPVAALKRRLEKFVKEKLQ
ncbi:MAG: Maf family protein [Ruminococcus sp.]|nr:Maf family protein [Ruminococcus sp.]MCM1380735.1 Maf family protein [Muribaculaceae bacterium]MCM1479153.1 Maf family protein [Muribaculaceae bacterium]